MHLTFLQPAYLWTLLVVPLAVVAYLLFERHRGVVAARFASPAMQAGLVERPLRFRRHVPPVLYLLALAALCISTARPLLISSERREQGTVILAIDASNSMRSTDVHPTRLAAAKRAASTFIERVPPAFRVGIESFSGNVRLVSVPLLDRAGLKRSLGSITVGPGTAIGDALTSALQQLSEQPAAGSVVVLLTDGNNTAGTVDPAEAARVAQQRGVPIFTVAVGTAQAPAGSGIHAAAPNRGFLEQIAGATGAGSYSASSSSQLNQIYGRLSSIVVPRKEREITWMFIAAGFVLALLGGGLAAAWLRRVP